MANSSRRRRSDEHMIVPMPALSPPMDKQMPYTHDMPMRATVEPTTRAVDPIRSHAEVNASRTRTPGLGEGYTMRIKLRDEK